jgi:hypothetical protein
VRSWYFRVRLIRRHGKSSAPRPFSLVPDLAQPHGSHHGLITDFNIRIDAQIVHPGRIPAPERAAFWVSYLKLDSYFHNLRAWNFEICTRPLSVVMHEGE